MMDGIGTNGYPSYQAKTVYCLPENVKGGICNGITADSNDTGILFMRFPYESDMQGENWRWNEQWIPHNAWFLMAISIM